MTANDASRTPAPGTLATTEDTEEIYSTAGLGDYFCDVLERNLRRRDFLKGSAIAAALALASPHLGQIPAAEASGALNFKPLEATASTVDQITVAEGHAAAVLIRWGDPVVAGAPAFNPNNQTGEAQAVQFGYNCDFIAFMPLPLESNTADHGLLWVNHEYTNPELMLPGYDERNPTKQQVDVELNAHGASIIEVRRDASGRWSVVPNSRYARRITAFTPMELSGPVVGSDWVKTTSNPDGNTVLGMLNNCGGGKTPWGTVLTAEENFQQYFANRGQLPDSDARKSVALRYGIPTGASERKWENHYDRFDMAKEPNESSRFGWIVEVDPYNPSFTPRKRTALGRFLHEAATCVVAPSGRVVAYCGDDARFEYVYKFVTNGTYNPNDRQSNMDLLDSGTLYVARFNDDGSGVWMPLVYGQEPLTEQNGFSSQADVLVRTRMAADALGATKMDRPEDVETNPVNGKVYIALTNNTNRRNSGVNGVNAANPRPNNQYGHIIELTEDRNDHGSTKFRWSIFLLCGDPKDETTYFAGFPKEKVSAIAAPDNILFDGMGNLWILSDGMPSSLKLNDGAFAVPVDGPERGYVRRFFGSVSGSETASGDFNTNHTALFLAVQHPGEGGSLDKPISWWPDGPGNIPRPSVVVTWNTSGGPIGVVQPAAGRTAPAAPTMPAALPRTGDAAAVGATLGVAAGTAAVAAGALIRLRSRAKRKAAEDGVVGE